MMVKSGFVFEAVVVFLAAENKHILGCLFIVCLGSSETVPESHKV